jgi:hypothetical protein
LPWGHVGGIACVHDGARPVAGRRRTHRLDRGLRDRHEVDTGEVDRDERPDLLQDREERALALLGLMAVARVLAEVIQVGAGRLDPFPDLRELFSQVGDVSAKQFDLAGELARGLLLDLLQRLPRLLVVV